MGCLRAGYYADDLLDNLGHPSARSILPEFQQLEIGQWVPMSPTPFDTTAFTVAGFEENRWLLWHQPLSTWSWTLTELPGGRTRLVTRLRIHLDWRHPATSVFSVVLNECGDFPMMRRMLLGIRDRVEAATGSTCQPSPPDLTASTPTTRCAGRAGPPNRRCRPAAAKLAGAAVQVTGRTVTGGCHTGEVLFLSALPQLHRSAVQDVRAFADRLEEARPIHRDSTR